MDEINFKDKGNDETPLDLDSKAFLEYNPNLN
jgi:hypothetical protein